MSNTPVIISLVVFGIIMCCTKSESFEKSKLKQVQMNQKGHLPKFAFAYYMASVIILSVIISFTLGKSLVEPLPTQASAAKPMTNQAMIK